MSQCGSPIEQRFRDEWEEYCGNMPVLIEQYKVGNYRVDFAHLPSMTAIELDGHATHSSPDAIAYDRKRQREIEQRGWHVIRFGGKEVMRDARACVVEACNLVVARWEHAEASPRRDTLVKLVDWFARETEAIDFSRESAIRCAWCDMPAQGLCIYCDQPTCNDCRVPALDGRYCAGCYQLEVVER